MKNIVVIGGGTGTPIVIKSLLSTGYSNITAIAVAMDSGGKTGIIRSDERDKIIAISDLLRCLLSLINPTDLHLPQVKAFTDLISYIDGRNRNLGYTIYYGLLEKYGGDAAAVQKHFESLLNISFAGQALPITTKPTHICFSAIDGITYKGEHELDRQSMSANTITDVWLEPVVSASPQALEAIKSATHLIYAPGSLYGSILSNFLPTGVSKVLHASTAQKILITNLVSNRNQNHQFSPMDYFNIFAKYTNLNKPFDVFVCPDIDRISFEQKHPETAQNYAREHSHFLGWNTNELETLKSKNILALPSPIWSITPQFHRLRHDITSLGTILKTVIQ